MPSVAPAKGQRRTLLPLPHPDPYIAMAFSIEQTGSDGDEVKTGDDADTMRLVLCMISLHHTPDHFVSLGFEFIGDDPRRPLSVWGHDHDGAYRQ